MSEDAFAALVARVGAFHVTDRAMKNAQTVVEEAIRKGTCDDRARAAYLDAVRRYFKPFEREARTHLRDVDRRLEHANQVVFNLTAERGVAVKRIEATQGVLADLATLEHTV
ncbi:MAG: hypothetical protein JO322_15380 [Candidatus Eremiobacteraeota bacterium]|nr:hypothetical protein [Candidatus Eremiobacteraeota bacterium]